MPTSRMMQEIAEQPAALQRTLDAQLRSIGETRRLLMRRRPRLIVLVARGTSDNAAQFGRYLLELTTGIPVSLAAPSVYTLYQAKLDLEDVLLIAISQSGESTDINVVVEQAKSQGAFTLGITNDVNSALARLVHHVMPVCAGDEKSVAATKTYTGQLLILYLLAHALGGGIALDDVSHLPEWVAAALALGPAAAALAAQFRAMERAVVVARGLNYANAFEFALKLMETCYVVAERFSAADFMHGPIAVLEPEFPVFLFAPAGVTWRGIADLQLRARKIGAQTFVISDRSNPAATENASHALQLPVHLAPEVGPADVYTPIPYIIPAQLFAASLAEAKGLDPDRPRALKKITQTL